LAYVVNELAIALDRQQKKGLNGSRILVIGLAYKKNIDDARESPSLVLIELLEARGATVDFHDPYVPAIPKTREHPKLANRKSVRLEPDVVSSLPLLRPTTTKLTTGNWRAPADLSWIHETLAERTVSLDRISFRHESATAEQKLQSSEAGRTPTYTDKTVP
jgi:hypothetical protein